MWVFYSLASHNLMDIRRPEIRPGLRPTGIYHKQADIWSLPPIANLPPATRAAGKWFVGKPSSLRAAPTTLADSTRATTLPRLHVATRSRVRAKQHKCTQSWENPLSLRVTRRNKHTSTNNMRIEGSAPPADNASSLGCGFKVSGLRVGRLLSFRVC